MAGMLAIAGPLLGLGSSLFGMSQGSPASNVQLPPSWQAPGMTDTANTALGMIGSNSGQNIPANILPLYQQIVGQLINNPGASGAMGGANIASGLGFNAANNASQSGDYLTQMGQMLGPQAMNLLQMGMDPQNELYGRAQHDTQEQTRAGLEARGLDMTPYGAGVEGKTMSNFNIDWQNNLLQRALSGAQGATGLLGSGQNQIMAGNQLGQQAPGLAQNAGMYPYTTFNQIGGDQIAGLNALSQAGVTAQTIPNQSIAQYLQYLGIGNNANSTANQTAQLGLNQANMGFQQNQIMGNQMGQSLAGLSNGIGNMYGGNTGWGVGQSNAQVGSQVAGGGGATWQSNPWGGYSPTFG